MEIQRHTDIGRESGKKWKMLENNFIEIFDQLAPENSAQNKNLEMCSLETH